MNKFTTRRPSRIPRLLRSERYGEVKYVARHTVLGGKTKQEWSLDIAIQGLANICKAKRATEPPPDKGFWLGFMTVLGWFALKLRFK